jgi:hypothetical protein
MSASIAEKQEKLFCKRTKEKLGQLIPMTFNLGGKSEQKSRGTRWLAV